MFNKNQSVADMALEFKAKQAVLKANFLNKLTNFIEARSKKAQALQEAIVVASEERDVAIKELKEAVKESNQLTQKQ